MERSPAAPAAPDDAKGCRALTFGVRDQRLDFGPGYNLAGAASSPNFFGAAAAAPQEARRDRLGQHDARVLDLQVEMLREALDLGLGAGGAVELERAARLVAAGDALDCRHAGRGVTADTAGWWAGPDATSRGRVAAARLAVPSMEMVAPSERAKRTSRDLYQLNIPVFVDFRCHH